LTAEAGEGPGLRPRLRLIEFTKRFGGTVALDGVSLDLAAGEIHGLVGQNGSGKSTLVKLIAGYHEPDGASAMEVDGKPVPLPPRPRDLHAAGVSLVHQDLGLLDDLSVAENIGVGQFERSRILHRIDWQRQAEVAVAALARVDAVIDPRAPVGSLGPAARAMVAIARGLLRQQPNSGVLILDESTRSLPPESLADVHAGLRRIAAAGGSILLVSHNLQEIMAVTDRVTVLRDGQVVERTRVTSEVDQQELARLMLGFDLVAAKHSKSRVARQSTIAVRGLRGATVRNVDLELAAGEIVGLTGLPGCGYEEVPYLLAGAGRCRSGTLELGGRSYDLAEASIPQLRRAGVVLVPERRDRDGLALEMSVADNITMPRLRERGKAYFVGIEWRRREVADVIARLGVTPREPELLARQLSGGNQQKVVLGKWLAGAPSLLILHEPTQAVDVGARHDILDLIRETADGGMPVIFASLEAGDLAAVCHRILVFQSGEISATISSDRRDDVIEQIYAGQLGRSVRVQEEEPCQTA
jgi:ribose transport system ATP-binding protein